MGEPEDWIGYVVEVREVGEREWFEDDFYKGTSATIDYLDNGVAYEVRVIAFNKWGDAVAGPKTATPGQERGRWRGQRQKSAWQRSGPYHRDAEDHRPSTPTAAPPLPHHLGRACHAKMPVATTGAFPLTSSRAPCSPGSSTPGAADCCLPLPVLPSSRPGRPR